MAPDSINSPVLVNEPEHAQNFSPGSKNCQIDFCTLWQKSASTNFGCYCGSRKINRSTTIVVVPSNQKKWEVYGRYRQDGLRGSSGRGAQVFSDVNDISVHLGVFLEEIEESVMIYSEGYVSEAEKMARYHTSAVGSYTRGNCKGSRNKRYICIIMDVFWNQLGYDRVATRRYISNEQKSM